jgi:heme-degrading monooxygenase HmoA
MFATLTTTVGSTEQRDMVAIAAIAGEEMARWLKELDGFVGLIVLSSRETGTTQVVSFWESSEVAESHRASRQRLRDKVIATVDVEVQETTSYEVSFVEFPGGRPPTARADD